MKIGYARTSTVRQDAGLAAQRRILDELGCGEVFAEQLSSVEDRAQLAAAIRYLRPGDQLVVTKLDRLARSLEHAICLERKIAERGASLVVLDPAMDTSTPMGRLLFGMLGAVAQFEREIMLERQREGIARAKAEGKYRGRQPTARRRLPEALALRAQGVAIAEIGRRLGLPRQTVHRLLAEAKAAAAVAAAEAAS
jgi:DNA invertase Pin-like site-specific DNA recombinase